jgi:NitT/TauT family transport system substrate-binding protein
MKSSHHSFCYSSGIQQGDEMQTKADRTWRAIGQGFVVIGLALLLQLGSATAQDLRKVSIRLDYFPDAQHAGYFVAKAKGYYKDVGLDVDIRTGTGSIQVVQQVAAGTDTFGNAFGLAIVSGRSAGALVKSVANYAADAQACIGIRADSGVTSPAQLKGKTIGSASGSPFATFLPIIWKKVGLSDDDVKVQALAPAAGLPDVVKGRISGWVGNSWQDPIVLEQHFNVKGKCLMFSDYGAGFMGPNIIASDKFIAENPAVVKAFVEASIKGWRYAFDNPKEAGDIVGAVNTGIQGTDPPEAVTAAQPILRQGVPHASTKGMPYGAMTSAEWQDTIAKMQEYLGLKNAPRAEDLFTNDFVPAGSPL